MFRRHCVKVLLVCLAAALVAGEEGAGTTRIFGGHEITIDKAAYVVQLRHNTLGHYCGGTLVSKRFVVTAAHCIKYLNVTDLLVVGGASTITEEGVQRKIMAAFIHDDYDSNTVHRDVAVLKLDRDMEGKHIEIMKLCDQQPKEDNEIQVSGWGLVSSNATESSAILRTIHILVASKQECAKIYATLSLRLTESMFCASLSGQKDSCNKDSGGPAIYADRLCGIVSWGKICGDPEYPGVYTDVMNVRSFIEASMLK